MRKKRSNKETTNEKSQKEPIREEKERRQDFWKWNEKVAEDSSTTGRQGFEEIRERHKN